MYPENEKKRDSSVRCHLLAIRWALLCGPGFCSRDGDHPEVSCGCSETHLCTKGVTVKHQQPLTFCCHQHLMSKIKKMLHFCLFVEVRSSCSVTCAATKRKMNSALLELNL